MRFSEGHRLNYSARRDYRAGGVLQRDCQVLTEHAESFGSIFIIAYSGVVVHTCNLSIQEANLGGLEVEIILGCTVIS